RHHDDICLHNRRRYGRRKRGEGIAEHNRLSRPSLMERRVRYCRPIGLFFSSKAPGRIEGNDLRSIFYAETTRLFGSAVAQFPRWRDVWPTWLRMPASGLFAGDVAPPSF